MFGAEPPSPPEPTPNSALRLVLPALFLVGFMSWSGARTLIWPDYMAEHGSAFVRGLIGALGPIGGALAMFGLGVAFLLAWLALAAYSLQADRS